VPETVGNWGGEHTQTVSAEDSHRPVEPLAGTPRSVRGGGEPDIGTAPRTTNPCFGPCSEATRQRPAMRQPIA